MTGGGGLGPDVIVFDASRATGTVQAERDVVLIPQSAHGTNPASAVMAGLKVVAVKTDARGNIDVEDLKAKAAQHADQCDQPEEGREWTARAQPLVLEECRRRRGHR